MVVTLNIKRKGLKEQCAVKSRARKEALRYRSETGGIDSRNDLLPKLTYNEVPIGEIKSAKRRVRRMTARQLHAVKRSIQRLGVCAPIILAADNSIIDGHVVYTAARELGLTHLPCVRTEHLTAEEERLLTVTLNRLAETGEWELDNLRLELVDLGEMGLTLDTTGFSSPELDLILQPPALLDDKGKNTEPKIDEVVTSQIGDLWELGGHRLLCGDACEEASYQALLGEDIVTAIFTDCPYNIPIKGFVSGLGKVKHEDFVAGCGEMTDDEFRGFLQRYLACTRARLMPGGVSFNCIDWRSLHLMVDGGTQAGFKHIHTCIWDKNNGGMGGLYRNAYENIVVFCNGDSPAVNNVELGRHGRDRTGMWRYSGANQRGSSASKALAFHSTPKSVEMVEDAILDVTNGKDLVLDPFMGSGTTIIAADSTGRRARGIELDPKYVDAAIRRWQDLTGHRAVHAETGLTFHDITERRHADDQD